MQKRIRCILGHDLSGIGRVSLNAIIPILSHHCIESIALPTSVFSSQTDGFDDYTFLDLTSFMQKSIEHWEKLHLQADALYTGFLSSAEQIEILIYASKKCLKKDATIVIDPVLGDQGKLFSSVSENLILHMQKYIQYASSITPNFTEICLLLEKDYREKPTLSLVKNYLKTLAIGKIQYSIGTSITLEEDNCPCVIAYDKKNDYFVKIPYTQIEGHFPGAGDSFTSVFTAFLLRGTPFINSLIYAVDFISYAITLTKKAQSPPEEGLLLEQSMHSAPNIPLIIRGRYEIYR